MIVYRYFLGCHSYSDVKTKYKELVKVHHPDRPTGSHDKFIVLQAEYELLGEGNYYPLRNTERTRAEAEFPQGFYDLNIRKYSKTYEEATQLDPKEIEKQRATNYFNKLREGDHTFDIIDQVIEKNKKEQLSRLWLYQEVAKQWDLNLDHFKYLTFKLGDQVITAHQLFKKYQLSKV